MFGKTKDTIDHDSNTGTDLTVDDFFGDEAAVAESVRVDHLQQRVTQVEQQITSQFTSLAAYAQIAQEQVEMVRSEAMHANERSEQKVISLVERERADRLAAANGGGDVTARLDALDAQLAEVREGLRLCLSNQKALADAITDLFAPAIGATEPTPAEPAAPPMPSPDPMPAAAPAPPTLDDHVHASEADDLAFDDVKPVHVPTEAPTLGAFPPPLTTTDGPAVPVDTGSAEGPIQALSLD